MEQKIITSYCSFPKDSEKYEEIQVKGYSLDNLQEMIAGSVCGLLTKTSDGNPFFKAMVPKK